MLDFKVRNNRENLVVFIHGFIGGEETWVRTDRKNSVMDYLIYDTEFLGKFDIAMFNYFTRVTDVFVKKKGWLAKIFGTSGKNQMNLPINDLADLLATQIDRKCHIYKRIILVAHSMGGLVSKSYIIRSKPLRVDLYISLAVPHNGSNLALLAEAIVGSPQVADLAPLGIALDEMTRSWIDTDSVLPRTIYFQGKYDDVVPKTSSIGFESRKKDIRYEYSDDDHFSIVTPNDAEHVVVLAVKQECWLALEPKPLAIANSGLPNASGQDIVLPTTENAVKAEFFRKELIKSINTKLNDGILKDFDGIDFFKRDFKDRQGDIFTFDKMREEIIKSDFVMISGMGGIGKSLTMKRLISDLSREFKNPFFIYCDAKNWNEGYLAGLEKVESISAQFTSLLDCFGANVTYSDIENLKITKYDQDVSKIIFVDGLNEIPFDDTRKKVVGLLNLLHREFGFKIVIVTRHFNPTEFKAFQAFKIEKVDRSELERILRLRFTKELISYSARNLEYLSIPFFLDIAMKSGVDKITGYSDYIYAHVLKNVEPRLHEGYLTELANLAYEAYQSDQKFVIPKSKILPSFDKKYIKTKILQQDGLVYKFEHHLVNEFLVALKMSKNPSLWNDDEFDRITFEDKKSFEIIQMILEQMIDEKPAEQYLKAVYDWNFYAVLHCIKFVENKYSKEFARVITLILTEKLFDRFSHTRSRIVDNLRDLFIKFEIKGIDVNRIQEIVDLNAGERKAKFQEIIVANKDYFIGGNYENWYFVFSNSAPDPEPDEVARIIDKDPLIGWTCSNVLKRNDLDENLGSQLMVLFEASTDPTQKWRIVHTLGKGNSDKIIAFLLKVLKQNKFTWVSYGALRSVLEIAMFSQAAIECEVTLNSLLSVLDSVLYNKDIIGELRACLNDKVEEEKVEKVNDFYDKIIASTHKNFEDKDLLESSKQKFIAANGA